MGTVVRPPYDPELSTVLKGLAKSVPPILTLANLPKFQTEQDALWTAEAALVGNHFTHEEIVIPGPDDNSILLSIFRPPLERRASGEAIRQDRPCIVWFHGGGMLLANRFIGVQVPLAWAKTCGAIVVSVEYRVAPAHPAPAAVEDCYAAMSWAYAAANASRLAIDRTKILVAGFSAGGGLAAGVSLMARDRAPVGGGPRICGLVLISPMLDDRIDEELGKQFSGENSPIWSTESNELAWRAVLGHRYGDDSVSSCVVPARATDVSGLPRIYLDTGSVDLFREQSLRFASRIWRAGGDLALHIWPGAFHGFDTFAPAAALSVKSITTRTDWVREALGDEIKATF
ncbi:alpha/beta hydrolase domain protein [Xylariaceae sp. AK1471]|nr:alpha/beta hydrolase domain protein [Xylariaceae sp. AK1471]